MSVDYNEGTAHMSDLGDTPILMSDIDLVADRSFETPTPPALPSGWITGGTGVRESSTTQAYRGNQSIKLQNQTSGNVYVSYRTAAGTYLDGVTMMFCVAVYPEGPSQPQINLRVDSETAADATVDSIASGTLSTGFVIGAWNLIYRIFRFTGGTTATKWRPYFILVNPLNENVYFDYMHFGIVHQLGRKFNKLLWREDPRVSLSIGDGAYQSVEMTNPHLQIQFGYDDVPMWEGSQEELAMIDWWKEARHGRPFTIWNNPTIWTPEGLHYERCVVARDYSAEYVTGGMARYPLVVVADVPLELKNSDFTRQ